MRTTIRDRAVADDLCALKAMRATCEIDFLQFTGDSSISRLEVPGLKSLGVRHTLHEVRYAKLSALPEVVLNCPLATLEFSVDFYPRGAVGADQKLRAIGVCIGVLHRRLAPWLAPFVRKRVFATGTTPAAARTLYDEDKEMKFDAVKGHWRILADPRWSSEFQLPSLTGLGVRSETLYYGDSPSPAWAGPWPAPSPTCQVRMYPKTTDKGVLVPHESWRARVEVTINGSALAQRYGVLAVKDIDQKLLRNLANDYLMLVQTLPSVLPRNQAPIGSVAWAVKVNTLRRAGLDQAAALDSAPEVGPIGGLECDHLLRYAVVPELMARIRTPVNDYFKSARRKAGRVRSTAGCSKTTGHPSCLAANRSK